MRKFLYHNKEDHAVADRITVKPLTDEQANQIDEFLLRSQALVESIKRRRKGKPLPSSWRLIRQAREERFKEL